VSNFLGKLKDMIGGGKEDFQDEEPEMEEMSNRDHNNSYEETMAMEEQPPQLELKPRRRRNRDKSTFRMELPAESNMETTNLPNNVIDMPGVNNAINEVVVIEPHSLDEIPQVIQTLKERRCVVLNLNVMDPDEAQRAVDFVAGGTYAIDGHQERIGESIFLFTPNTVRVSTVTGGTPQVKQPSSLPLSSSKYVSNYSSRSLWDEDSSPLAQ
jgi:cell division inhibitor SepF